VVSDEAAGARAAVEHLLETGRRRIAHVTGPPGHHSAVVRAEAFEATLAAHGAQAAGGRIWFGAWSEIWGRQAAQGLLAADAGVDAVFCGSDQIARGVLEFVGRTAGELLLRAIDGHASGGTHVIQPRLVIRESSGPAGRPAAER
jgi:LacI family transcriptional regulator